MQWLSTYCVKQRDSVLHLSIWCTLYSMCKCSIRQDAEMALLDKRDWMCSTGMPWPLNSIIRPYQSTSPNPISNYSNSHPPLSRGGILYVMITELNYSNMFRHIVQIAQIHQIAQSLHYLHRHAKWNNIIMICEPDVVNILCSFSLTLSCWSVVTAGAEMPDSFN